MSDYETLSEYSTEIEIVQTSLNSIKNRANGYIGRIQGKEKFSNKDLNDLEDMKKETSTIREIISKVPILGDLIEVTADLTEILNRAIKLMIENMQTSQKTSDNKKPTQVNGQVNLSDEISQVMRSTEKEIIAKEKSGQTLENGGQKLVARSNYFGYEEGKDEVLAEFTTAEKEKEEIKNQKRLDAYNEDVKKRGEKSFETEEREKSSSDQQSQPAPANDN